MRLPKRLGWRTSDSAPCPKLAQFPPGGNKDGHEERSRLTVNDDDAMCDRSERGKKQRSGHVCRGRREAFLDIGGPTFEAHP